MYGSSRYPTPLLHFTGQEYTRLSLEDYVCLCPSLTSQKHDQGQQARLYKRWTDTLRKDPTALNYLLFYSRRGLSGALELLKILLPVSVMGYQFYEWFLNSDLYKQSLTFPVPPPPDALPVSCQESKTRASDNWDPASGRSGSVPAVFVKDE